MRDRANHFTTPLGLHELRLVERDVRQRTAEEEETRAHSGEEMREEKKNVNADTGLGRDDASKAREFDNPLMFSVGGFRGLANGGDRGCQQAASPGLSLRRTTIRRR